MAKKGSNRRRRKGSISKLRGGFGGMFKKSRSGKSDPKEFMYMLLFLFAIGAIVFFMGGR